MKSLMRRLMFERRAFWFQLTKFLTESWNDLRVEIIEWRYCRPFMECACGYWMSLDDLNHWDGNCPKCKQRVAEGRVCRCCYKWIPLEDELKHYDGECPHCGIITWQPSRVGVEISPADDEEGWTEDNDD